jgi:hypothetical protein
MIAVIYTTLIKTKDNEIYDMGKRKHPPAHTHPQGRMCSKCEVINAWTEFSREVKDRK